MTTSSIRTRHADPAPIEMENRRPPRPSSAGRKSFDRGHDPARPYARNRKANTGRTSDSTVQKRRGGDSTKWTGEKDRSRGRWSDRPQGHRYGNRPPKPGQASKRNRTEPPLIEITSEAQICDGKFRGRALQNSTSPAASQTSLKLRQLLFRTLARRIKAARVLDLGCGCGTVGFEAISRGAMLVTFVDRSARLCSFLRKNLTELGVKDGHAEVIEMEILPYLIKSARRKRTWDIVYLDIPAGPQHDVILHKLSRGSCIRPNGFLFVQHNGEASLPETLSQLKRRRSLEDDKTILSVYERI